VLSQRQRFGHVEAMHRSVELLKVKYLFCGWLNAGQERSAALALEEAVSRLYQLGSHIPLRWKITLLKRNCSAKAICLMPAQHVGFL